MHRFLLLGCFVLTALRGLSQEAKVSRQTGFGQDAPQLTSIRTLIDSSMPPRDGQVLLRGTITHIGDPVVIQDQTGAIAVYPASPTRLALGDEAEVRGRFSKEGEGYRVQDAAVASLWHSSMPAPLALPQDLAAEGQYDLYLVMVEGTLRGRDTIGEHSSQLTLEGGHQFFSARFTDDCNPGTIALGSRLQVTGVLYVRKIHDALDTGSFTVLLRSVGDVVVVAAPPWWTARHIALLSLLLIPLGMAVHFVRLRTIRRRFDAVTEERARIARDIHDTLAQGFAGVAFQLEGAKEVFARDHSTAQNHLNLALKMIRFSRLEAHRSISALHSSAAGTTVEAMLEGMIGQMSLDPRFRVQLDVVGRRRVLPSEAVECIFRIAQEAVSNALQHAKTGNVSMRLEYTEFTVGLKVIDDGSGFDPSSMPGPDSGHFGVAGMMERAQRLKGTLQIESSNQGTCLAVEIPVPPAKTGPVRPALLPRRQSR